MKRYAMILLNRVINIEKAQEAPQYPPDQEGNKVTAMECDDTVQIGDKVIDGIIVGTYVPKEPEMTEQELIQTEILLNQSEIIAKQKEQDEVLAELLLGQQEVAKND